MSPQTSDKNSDFWLENFHFVKIFKSFRSAIQPGKLMLALTGLVAICLVGWVLDGLSPDSAKVIVDVSSGSQITRTEIDAYVAGDAEARKNFDYYRDSIKNKNESILLQLLMSEPLGFNAKVAAEMIEDGKALAKVSQSYQEQLDNAIETLADRYEIRRRDVIDHTDRRIKRGESKGEQLAKRDEKLEKLKGSYLNAFKGLTEAVGTTGQKTAWINQLIVIDPLSSGQERDAEIKLTDRVKKQLLNCMALAQANHAAQSIQGEGLFGAFLDFKLTRLHNAASFILEGDLPGVKTEIHELIMGACWLFRFHPIYGIILTIASLAIFAVVGGAICRITALQFARDERIGPLLALKFSMSKFSSFFTAPLIPIAIIIAISIVILVPSLLVAIPWVGEIIGGLLLPVALLGGFVIALVTVGLIGGYNLMFPTIAVEGSDSFDAISRSFSYIFARPWRMGFYSLTAVVYGAICYLFVRFFVFLMLCSVHCSIKGVVNWDGSSLIGIRGKLDAIWPAPLFDNLQPAVNWAGLNGSEAFGAGLIWIWVSLAVAVLMAFVISFLYSVNTTIYFLLRHKVDDTDMEDIFVEQDVEELVGDESDLEKSPEQITPPLSPDESSNQDTQSDTPKESSDQQPEPPSEEEKEEKGKENPDDSI